MTTARNVAVQILAIHAACEACGETARIRLSTETAVPNEAALSEEASAC